MRKNQCGFTLIEIMMVVIIIGILTAIAVPAYSDYLIRSRITQATAGLSEKRVRMEQFFQDNHTYFRAAAGADPEISSLACADDTTASQYFNFTCPTLTATTYTLTATGKSSMSGFTYTLDQANVRSSTIASPAPSGWVHALAACWMTNKGGGC
ncbi:MAG: type IV pilin protein [Candidatus Accumulibacter meliphilus]|uniref:type IV pilin protein n=1 Tax=Candidatus Accumulibacter meliphilus TaxID=2211374 RepID=UPI002FC317ED